MCRDEDTPCVTSEILIDRPPHRGPAEVPECRQEEHVGITGVDDEHGQA